MDKRQTLVILLLVTAFGLFVHGLKVIHRARLQQAPDRQFLAADIDDTPYHVTDEEMDEDQAKASARSKSGGLRLASAPTSAAAKFNQYDFGGARVVSQDAKAKEELKKKKKKKSARKANEQKVATAVVDDRTYYKEKPKDKIVDDNSGGTSTQTFINSNPQTQKSGLPISYQDWAQLILPAPSPANVAKLIEYYKNGMVSSEVYYSLLEAMMSEPNPKQQKLAIYAAGETPSVQSFEFLVQVEKSQPNTQSAATASQNLGEYKIINQVQILRAVLTTYMSDALTIQYATAVLQASAETYIANRTPTAVPTGGGTGTTKTGNPTAQTLASAYAGFAPILTQIIATYRNQAAIVDAAQKSLALINSVAPVVTH